MGFKLIAEENIIGIFSKVYIFYSTEYCHELCTVKKILRNFFFLIKRTVKYR